MADFHWRSPAHPEARRPQQHRIYEGAGTYMGVPAYGMSPQVQGEVHGAWGRVSFDVDTAVASSLLLLIAPVIMRGLRSNGRR